VRVPGLGAEFHVLSKPVWIGIYVGSRRTTQLEGCTLRATGNTMRSWVMILAVAAVVALSATSSAFSEAPPRVRGVVAEVDNGSITVKERNGSLVTLTTGVDTTYAVVLPSSLDQIKVNDFVGTAVKGPLSSMVAVEVVIIPESMRAGRISYYGWDPLPDPTAIRTFRSLCPIAHRSRATCWRTGRQSILDLACSSKPTQAIRLALSP
jgi:hypothetical protein